jgi:hypothetical protein
MSQPPVDFSNLVGREIPGGCEECNAFQTMSEVSEGVWSLVVHHDDDCRFYRAHVGRSGAD